jgi:hypothetical protein
LLADKLWFLVKKVCDMQIAATTFNKRKPAGMNEKNLAKNSGINKLYPVILKFPFTFTA